MKHPDATEISDQLHYEIWIFCAALCMMQLILEIWQYACPAAVKYVTLKDVDKIDQYQTTVKPIKHEQFAEVFRCVLPRYFEHIHNIKILNIHVMLKKFSGFFMVYWWSI